jgi:anhydro-N-acetylmuramic acid kinase
VLRINVRDILDGVDGAICVTNGRDIIRFGKTYFRPYSSKEQLILKSKLNSWPESADLEEASKIVQNAHLDVIKQFPRCRFSWLSWPNLES